MKLRDIIATAVALLFAFNSSAEEKGLAWQKEADNHLIQFDAEARLDWQYVGRDGTTDRSQTGFIGKYIAVKAYGTIAEGLTYTWRQRFSRTPHDHTFWDQTDFLDLNYTSGKWSVGAGKQVVLIGGYEYDRAPINLMCPNIFVANVACYQFGVSGGFQIAPSDKVLLQVSQSPFALPADRNLYAYNLMWRGSHRVTDNFRVDNIWSVNEIEFEKGQFCNYVALGNKLVFNDCLSVLIDATVRTYPKNNLFKNNTFMGEVAYDLSPAWRFTGKVSYDCNLGVNKTALTEVSRGTRLTSFGGVVEWFPIRDNRKMLRAHAAVFYSTGRNTSSEDLMRAKTLYASVGLTWHMNFLNIK